VCGWVTYVILKLPVTVANQHSETLQGSQETYIPWHKPIDRTARLHCIVSSRFNVLQSHNAQTPLASFVVDSLFKLLYNKLQDSSMTKRKSAANAQPVVRHRSTSSQRPRTTRQHRNMSRRCTVCCTTCCPTSPQQIEVVEFGLKPLYTDGRAPARTDTETGRHGQTGRSAVRV